MRAGIPEAGATSTAFLPIRWVDGAYQIRNRLVVDIRGQTRRHRAITEHLEPVREQQERQIAAEFRHEDNWLAVAKLSLASEIDRLPGDRHRIDPGSCQHPRPARKKLHCRCEKIDEIGQSAVAVLRDGQSQIVATPFGNVGQEFRDEPDTFVGRLPHHPMTAARNDDQARSGNETCDEFGVLR